MPDALELRGEQQVPLQLFFASLAAARRVRTNAVLEAPWSESSRNIELLSAKSFFDRVFTVERALRSCALDSQAWQGAD